MKHLKTYEKHINIDDYDTNFINSNDIDNERFKITDITVKRLFDNGGASGYISIEYEDGHELSDTWIKYDSEPKIAFDNYYSSRTNLILKQNIEKAIKKERVKQNADKYNI